MTKVMVLQRWGHAYPLYCPKMMPMVQRVGGNASGRVASRYTERTAIIANYKNIKTNNDARAMFAYLR